MSSQNDPVWLSEALVLAIHDAQIAEHGGAGELRDAGLLTSALARPRHARAYSGAEVAELAALYALGIIKNHPFMDGNKRVGAVLLETFLELNGYFLIATDEELLRAILRIASGEIDEETFIKWVHEKTAASA